jgi:hypothetical protein
MTTPFVAAGAALQSTHAAVLMALCAARATVLATQSLT